MRIVSLILKHTQKSLMFILRERENVSGGRAETVRETQNPKQAPGLEMSAQSLPDAGLELTNGKILTWAKVGRLN